MSENHRLTPLLPQTDPFASYGYDDGDQLTGAARTEGGVEVSRRSWIYDPMGNRTSETRGTGGAKTWAVNAFNQLTADDGLQAVEVRGTLNRPAEVKLDGQGARVHGLEFSATLTLSTGPHELALEARQPADVSGPAQTVKGKVQLTVEGGGPQPYSYDANGNLRNDGSRTYEWDAENRLVAVSGAWGRSEFTYDGLSRRVKIADNGVERCLVWDGLTIAEERDASGAVVKRLWGVGEERFGPQGAPPPTQLYYQRDHLGSLRLAADASGIIRARYNFSEWGERTKTEGDLDGDFGFTGHYYHAPSGITLAPYRAYDSRIGRWLSRDAIGENGGPNLYGYVNNSSPNFVDNLGLDPQYFYDGNLLIVSAPWWTFGFGKPKVYLIAPEGAKRILGNERLVDAGMAIVVGAAMSGLGGDNTTHDNYDKAREKAQSQCGDLGPDRIPEYEEKTGTLVGEKSADGKRGWRNDPDHFNCGTGVRAKKERVVGMVTNSFHLNKRVLIRRDQVKNNGA